MRITGGFLRGRTITPPDDMSIRPTADKTRLAIFNMLESRGAVRDAVVMDIFCGTGALGIEGLSRGAPSCTFVDASKVSIDLARANAQKMDVTKYTSFILKDTGSLGQRPAAIPPAMLVFLDPPYRKNLVIPTLEVLVSGDWLAPSAWIVAETEKEFRTGFPTGFDVDITKTYGETAVFLMTYKG